MRTYTVHERPDPAIDVLDRAEALVFVREGFSWAAAVLTPFWMIAHGLWLALVAYIAGLALMEGLQLAGGLDPQLASVLLLGVVVIVGYEAGAIRRWTLQQRGYTTLGAVSGRTMAECERRFFEAWVAGRPPMSPDSGENGRGSRPATGRLSALALASRR